jgi:hypothetical protein
MSDIVEQLRTREGGGFPSPAHELCLQAADEIERLRTEIGQEVDAHNETRAEIERLTIELEKGAQRLSDMRAAAGKMGIERAWLEAEIERLREYHRKWDEGAAVLTGRQGAEIGRLRAENAEHKAEMQKLYDNWVRVLHGSAQDE